MNSQALLSEFVFLMIITILSTGYLSGIQQTYQDQESPGAQSNYDLVTKWQNLRFILDQATTNAVADTQILPNGNCRPFSPSSQMIEYNSSIQDFNNATHLECEIPNSIDNKVEATHENIGTPSQPLNVRTTTALFLLRCTDPQGNAVFEQELQFKKERYADLLGNNCGIRDGYSGEEEST